MNMKKEKIVKVKRDNLGRIVEFQTDSNKIYDYEMATEAINEGKIINAHIISRSGLKEINDPELHNFSDYDEF